MMFLAYFFVGQDQDWHWSWIYIWWIFQHWQRKSGWQPRDQVQGKLAVGKMLRESWIQNLIMKWTGEGPRYDPDWKMEHWQHLEHHRGYCRQVASRIEGLYVLLVLNGLSMPCYHRSPLTLPSLHLLVQSLASWRLNTSTRRPLWLPTWTSASPPSTPPLWSATRAGWLATRPALTWPSPQLPRTTSASATPLKTLSSTPAWSMEPISVDPFTRRWSWVLYLGIVRHETFKVSPALETGVSLGWSSASAATTFGLKQILLFCASEEQFSPGIGAKYVLPDGAAVRAKINNKSEV